MNTAIRLSWLKAQEPRECRSTDELVASLCELNRDRSSDDGIAAIVEKPNAQSMTVIMAGDLWSLDWFPKDYDGLGSYHTLADEFDPDVDQLPAEPEVVTFYLYGHHGEVPIQFAIPAEQALVVIREFLATDSMPSCARWGLD